MTPSMLPLSKDLGLKGIRRESSMEVVIKHQSTATAFVRATTNAPNKTVDKRVVTNAYSSCLIGTII